MKDAAGWAPGIARKGAFFLCVLVLGVGVVLLGHAVHGSSSHWLGLIFPGAALLALYWVGRTYGRRKQHQQALPGTPNAVNFAASATQLPPINEYSTEGPVSVPAASGKPTRCVLLKYPSSWGAFRGEGAGPPRPGLALDLGTDAIWVIDPNTNELMASASLGQVTATPAKHETSSDSRSHTTAVLVVAVPGLEPLTIGSTTFAGGYSFGRGLQHRFSWRGKVRKAKRPAYFVTDGVWLTLVEKFGLTPYLEDYKNQR